MYVVGDCFKGNVGNLSFGDCQYSQQIFYKEQIHNIQRNIFGKICIQAYFIQAIYNLGLENVRLDLTEEEIWASEKLLTFVPSYIFVVYQISNLY